MEIALRRFLLLFILASCMVHVGCGGKETTVPMSQTDFMACKELSNSLRSFAKQFKRFPKNETELLSAVKKDLLDRVTKSGRDGKPMIVIWGGARVGSDNNEMVFCHEESGISGFRLAITENRVYEISDEEFSKLQR